MRFSNVLKLGLLAALVLLVIVVLPRTEWGAQNLPHSFEDFQRRVESYSPYDRWAYVGLYVAGTLLFVPGTVLSFVGAALFGTFWGTILTWSGAVIGSTLTFIIVRFLGREGVKGWSTAFSRAALNHSISGLPPMDFARCFWFGFFRSFPSTA